MKGLKYFETADWKIFYFIIPEISQNSSTNPLVLVEKIFKKAFEGKNIAKMKQIGEGEI